MRIKPNSKLNSGDYAAAMYGLLYDNRAEAVARAQVLNGYRQSRADRARISQTDTGYWQVWEPGTLALAGRDLLAKTEVVD